MRTLIKLLVVAAIGLAFAKPGPPPRRNGGNGPVPSPPVGGWRSGQGRTKDNFDQGPAGGNGQDQGGQDGGSQPETPSGPAGWSTAEMAAMPNFGHVPDKRRVHILDGEYDFNGDHEGGGHASGVGIPGNSEFPERWDDDQIIANVQEAVQNPTPPHVARPNGGWDVQGTVDGVVIQIHINRDGTIWSAYPLSGDGVVVNPEE